MQQLDDLIISHLMTQIINGGVKKSTSWGSVLTLKNISKNSFALY